MAQRVDLHVGMPRAGAGYLQKLLRDNRAEIEAGGVNLLTDSARSLGRSAQDLARNGAEHWPVLVEAIRAEPGRVLLSWEGLAGVGPAGAARAVADLAPAEVRVICTVKDPVRLIPSLWQLHVRTGRTETLEDFIRRARAGEHRDLVPDPVEVADTWAAAVAASHVRIVVVPPNEAQADLMALFAAAADLDPAVLTDPGAVETPPDAVALELHRRVNIALGDRVPSFVQRYRDLVRPMVLRGTSETVEYPAVLAGEDLAWAIERGQAVADGFGQRPYEVFGDLEHLEPDAVAAEAHAVDEAAVAQLGADMVARLLLALRYARRQLAGDSKPLRRRNPPPRFTGQSTSGVDGSSEHGR